MENINASEETKSIPLNKSPVKTNKPLMNNKPAENSKNWKNTSIPKIIIRKASEAETSIAPSSLIIIKNLKREDF